MRHHTKDKGDEGLGQITGDFMTHGVHVAVPLSEHLPFDLSRSPSTGRCAGFRYATEPH